MNTYSTTNSTSENHPDALAASIRLHPKAAFAALMFALAWLPLLLTGILPFFAIALITAAAPLIAAGVVKQVTGQKPLTLTWHSFIPSGVQWYLYLLIPVLAALTITGLNAIAPDKVAYPFLPVFVMTLITMILLATSEKHIWRGSVRSELSQSHSPLMVWLIMLVWTALVYLPLYLLPAFAQPETPYLTHLPFVVAVMVLSMWLWHWAYLLRDGASSPRLWRKILRTVRRGLLSLPVLIFAFVTTSILYQRAAEIADYSSIAAPGQMVNIGDHSLHLYCTGTGSPTIVLEAGNGAWSTDWHWIQAELAKTTRVCSYDRAGSGWSEPDPNPAARDASVMAEDLHTLLNNAGIEAPYIMAGHSMGGLYTRIFTAQYPEDVAGLVLLDPTYPDDGTLYGVTPEVMQAQNDATYVQFGVLVRLGVMRPYALAPGLPEASQQIRAALWMTSQSFEATRTEVAFMTHNMRLTIQAGNFGDLPLAVILADHPEWNDGSEMGANVKAAYESLAQLSTNSIYRIVAGANHGTLQWNQQYASEAAAEIGTIVQAVRTGQRVSQ